MIQAAFQKFLGSPRRYIKVGYVSCTLIKDLVFAEMSVLNEKDILFWNSPVAVIWPALKKIITAPQIQSLVREKLFRVENNFMGTSCVKREIKMETCLVEKYVSRAFTLHTCLVSDYVKSTTSVLFYNETTVEVL